MKIILPAIAVALTLPGAARAETAVKLESCAEARAALDAYAGCRAAGYKCKFVPTTQCWDFENGLTGGGFGAWTTYRAAFTYQPTYGDNVATSRVHWGMPWWQQLNDIGGNYWEVPYPIGHQGSYWIGSYEKRPTPADPWGSLNGDLPQGWMESPSFVVDRNYLWFLIGGGCDLATQYIELQVHDGTTWTRAVHAVTGAPFVRTGACSELFQRDGWVTDAASGLQGKTVRVVVTDGGSGAWGHINVDHIVHTSAMATDFGGANQPVWGFADTHAHVGNHLAFRSLGGVTVGHDPTNQWAGDGYLFHGSPGHLDPGLLAGDLPSCDGMTPDRGGHGAFHMAADLLLGTVEAMSFGDAWASGYPKHLPALFEPKAGDLDRHGHPAGGVVSPFTQGGRDLEGWPYWWTRAHQQMHVTWIQRAYKGGQRLLVAAASNNEALGSMLRAGHIDGVIGANYLASYLSDFGALRRFAVYMKTLAAQNSTWMEIAYSPQDARRIIRANKLAILLATEVDDVGDHCFGNLSGTGATQFEDASRTTTTSSSGSNPWTMVKDRAHASACSTANDWTQRVQALYDVGYRVIMPIHLADNDLGGAALYGGKMFNAMNRFLRGQYFQVEEPDVLGRVAYRHENDPPEMAWCQQAGCAASAGMAWAMFVPYVQHRIMGTYTPAQMAPLSPPSYPPSAFGHINPRPLTVMGEVFINAVKARGMIVDLSHMGRKGRHKVLGLAPYQTSSLVASTAGCDMTTAACQAAAYPAVATHSGLYAMTPETNEADLTPEMIERIRAIGGTVATGTAGGDLVDTDVAGGGQTTGIYAQNVGNTCGGSSRSFAQAYIYTLRAMKGRQVTLGTDINGMMSQLNPRFGTTGCYARGNVPWVLAYSPSGKPLVSHYSSVPFKYRKEIVDPAASGTFSAGAQRRIERTTGKGINYKHYNGAPPGESQGEKFRGLADPVGWLDYLDNERFRTQPIDMGYTQPISMFNLSSAPPMNASVTGNRTFDFNYDGLAHYGMIPDMLQDMLAVGMTQEQLGPLFLGAEYVIQAWEKSCRLSTPGVSGAGCQ